MTPRPTVDELEALVREALSSAAECDVEHLAPEAEAALSDLAARAKDAEQVALDAFAMWQIGGSESMSFRQCVARVLERSTP